MAFTTERIEDAFAKAIANGVKEEEKIEQKLWGQKVGYVRDNNGFLIELSTPM